MNLIEAIRTNLPLRRKGRASWPRKTGHGEHSSVIICDPARGQWMDPRHLLEVCLMDQMDVLAEDWEVDEPSVTITRTQFWGAFEELMERYMLDNRHRAWRETAQDLARKLGLDP